MFKKQVLQFGYLPLVYSQRFRVRILPRQPYNMDVPSYPEDLPQEKSESSLTNLLAMAHRKWTLKDILKVYRDKRFKKMVKDQKYMPERHSILGPDLAAAHFLTFRGAKVKFKGIDKWITDREINDDEIPKKYVPGFLLEEIDASFTTLVYEGFENLGNLRRLKKLFLRKCHFIDDWCLHRFHMFANSLEYLDISGCHNVTERGVCSLHQLKKLKTLVMADMAGLQNKELVSLLLQDLNPKCEIKGVDYSDPELLKRLEPYLAEISS